MHPRLLALYNLELGHLREMAQEFAREFPKIASRLSLDSVEVADPYVERLLEGFAFLAARVHLKIDSEYATFVHHLMEVAYPNLAAPVPAMMVACLVPDRMDPALVAGVRVERGARLRSLLKRGADTTCEFRTAHEVALSPLEVEAAQVYSFAPDLPLLQLPQFAERMRGGLRVRLAMPEGQKIAALKLDRLCFHISAPDEAALRLYELLFGAGLGAVAVTPGPAPAILSVIGPAGVRAVGFADDEALLPVTRAGFRGYRLLQEYAALPQRFLFFEVSGLAAALARCPGSGIEIVFPFSRAEKSIESLIDRDGIRLNCTPAVNLFLKRLDRVDVSGGQVEMHVVADRGRPVDFEIREIHSMIAYGGPAIGEQRFRPLYAATHEETQDHRAYFTLSREPRVLPAKARLEGVRSPYVGTEVYVSLVDRDCAPFQGDLRQLAIDAWCTNRDLPMLLPSGGNLPADRNDFHLESGAPVKRVQCLRGPSAPRETFAEGRRAWALISQLSLNYLSIVQGEGDEGASALRSMLSLYCDTADASLRRQIDGIRSVSARRVARRAPGSGPLALASGVEVTLTVDTLAFQGASAFLLGKVLENLLSRHVGINSFVELIVRSTARTDILHAAPLQGQRAVL